MPGNLLQSANSREDKCPNLQARKEIPLLFLIGACINGKRPKDPEEAHVAREEGSGTRRLLQLQDATCEEPEIGVNQI